MRYLAKNIFLTFLIFFIIAGVFTLVYSPTRSESEISLNAMVQEINAGNVSKVIVRGNNLEVELADGSKVKSRKETEASLSQTLQNFGVSGESLNKVNID